MRAADLLILAELYSERTGIRMWPLSGMATGNGYTFSRIARGRGCHTRTAERAFAWFYANWPPDLEWPPAVPRRCRCEAAE